MGKKKKEQDMIQNKRGGMYVFGKAMVCVSHKKKEEVKRKKVGDPKKYLWANASQKISGELIPIAIHTGVS